MDSYQNFLDQIKLDSDNLNSLLSANLVKLSQLGWYIDENISLLQIIEMGKLADQNRIVSINNFFKNYYTNRINEIIEKQIANFSERAPIIEEARKAHDSKLFFSSTSLFLSQSDGICNGELFKTRKDKISIKEFLSEKYSSFSTMLKLLEVITQESAIDVYHPHKSKYSSTLNRHGVFHGYDINYGTELNSLKALSLFSFITSVATRYKIWQKE